MSESIRAEDVRRSLEAEFRADLQIVRAAYDARGDQIDRLTAEVERLRAEKEQAYEAGMRSLLMIRCIKHREVPQYNRDESSGAECAACAVDNLQAALNSETEFRERAVTQLAQVIAEKTEIVGIVQRWQPAGSPAPGSAQMLVRWICQTLEKRAEQAEARLAKVRVFRDKLKRNPSDTHAYGPDVHSAWVISELDAILAAARPEEKP